MNWIDQVLKGTSHVETPKSFLRWSLFSAISAVASPNVSLSKQGAYNLHPNIYVMLLADSGLGKGFGVWIAKSLVKIVDNTRVFSGRNSIQKIVTDLSMAYSRPQKEMVKDARAFLASGEFVNLLLRDDQSISILTEWYDTHYVTEWENSLKSSGVEKLTKVNITLLGASNDEYLRESVPPSAIKGGFFGRFCFIYEKEKANVNPLIDEPTEDEDVKRQLPGWTEYLKKIAKIEPGSQFKVTERARGEYRKWYYDLNQRIKDGKLVDKTGYIHRIHDHALKIGMVLSLSEDISLELKSGHVEEGIYLAESLLATVKKTTLGHGLSTSAPKNEVFLRELYKAQDYTVSRKKMLQNHNADFDSNELDRITLTMEDAGFIQNCGDAGNAVYRLTPLGRKQFTEIMFKKRKKKDV